jgi:hypothetical protein
MKILLSILSIPLLSIFAKGNEDHLVLVPIPIIHVQDSGEHTVIRVPYVSGYGLDFMGYCSRIAKPYFVEVHSPSSKDKRMDINPLSRAGVEIDAEDVQAGGVHPVTIDFSGVKDVKSHTDLLVIATKCIYLFGDSTNSEFTAKFQIKGVPEGSSLFAKLKEIENARKAKQQE